MKIYRRLISISIIVCTLPCVGSAMDEQSALTEAKALFSKLKVSMPAEKLATSKAEKNSLVLPSSLEFLPDRTVWNVYCDNLSATFDDKSGSLIDLMDADEEDRLRGPKRTAFEQKGKPFRLDESQWITYAVDKMRILGISTNAKARVRKGLPKLDAEGDWPRFNVVITFSEEPNGYKSNFNTQSITLDSLDGMVFAVEGSFPTKYATPDIKITAEDAAKVAGYPLDDMLPKPAYNMLLTSNSISDEAKNYIKQDTAPLSYLFHFDGNDICVSASTGMILWQDGVAGTPAKPPPDKPDENRAWPIIGIVGAAGIAGMIYVTRKRVA
ncbi:hypothetical protein BH11ARM1_BH11ARM1_09680 [soil metagenome]